jgi:ketosteroid isomerase-like protein
MEEDQSGESQAGRQPEQLINDFYSSFQRLDWKGMLSCYRADIFFYDPVFENLEGAEVRAMWEMLLSRAADLQLRYSDVQTDHAHGSCRWVATYTFSTSGRKVVNEGLARFTFDDGMIVEHQDEFSLWKWSRQALGITGLFFGATPFLQNKIRRNARKSLDKFMAAAKTAVR